MTKATLVVGHWAQVLIRILAAVVLWATASGVVLWPTSAEAQSVLWKRHTCQHGFTSQPWDMGLYDWLRYQRNCVAGGPLFEFAPTSGAGMGQVCGIQNAATQSEAFDNAVWIKQGISAAAPVVTANQALSPTGTLTADRVDFAATTGAGTYSWLTQIGVAAAGVPFTHSVWAQGVSGSGTIDLCGGAPSGCAPCNFVAGAWTRCQMTGIFTSANLGVGNTTGLTGTNRPAQSVYLWGFQAEPYNATGVASTYLPTAAVAVFSSPTGSKGEPMTFSRASTAMCSKKGLDTINIQNGDLVLAASGQPRAEPDTGTGVLGLLTEPGVTNLALRSQEFDNAAWTKGASGVAAPIVTANQATAPDGTLTADRVQFAACPAAGNQSIVFQSLGTGTTTQSVYVKGNGSGGTMAVCTGTPGACDICTYNASSWTRCWQTATTSVTGYIIFGCNNDAVTYTGAANSGAADVFLWGAQYEVSSQPTSYIPTTSASATRQADLAYFDLGAAQLASGPLAQSLGINYSTMNANPTLTSLSGPIGLDDTLNTSGPGLAVIGHGGAGLVCYGGGAYASPTGPLGNVYTNERVACDFSGTTMSSTQLAGTGVDATATGPIHFQYVWVGRWSGTGLAISYPYLVSRVCADGTPGTCKRDDPVPEPELSFAPASGRGMPDVCALLPDAGWVQPTGARGEALTFARASTAYCTKTQWPQGGNSALNIATGDLVQVPVDMPRVEYDAYGKKGLRVEAAATNIALRSQEFDNAAWAKGGAGSGTTPIVTADYGIAPDGTQTADRIQVSGCAGAGQSVLNQTLGASGVNIWASLYLKGTSTSGAVSICTGTTPSTCAVCAFNPTTWIRCATTPLAPAANGYFVIGCNDSVAFTGHSNTGAADFLAWGAQYELQSNLGNSGPSSYIPTTTVAATRPVEIAEVDTQVHLNDSASAGVSVNIMGSTGDSGWLSFFTRNNALGFLKLVGFPSSGNNDLFVNGVAQAAATTGAAAGQRRFAGYWGSTATRAYANGFYTNGPGPVSEPTGNNVNRAMIGDYNAPNVGTRTANGVYSRICASNALYQCGDMQEPAPYFEFAPASALGLSATCDCQPVTGSKGETMTTMTRSTAAYCTKGNTVTGIANGDLVSCPANTPRLMPGGDGSGGNGIMVEANSTNYLFRSQQLENASWTATSIGGRAAPIVTADAATAPDGTLTAERVQFDSCVASGTASVLYQNYTGVASNMLGSVYVKGNGTSGTLGLYFWDTTASTGNLVTCPYTASTWTRCGGGGQASVPILSKAFANVTQRFGLGCMNDPGLGAASGYVNTGAADVFLWGAQAEQYLTTGPFAPTSYIPTVGASATRGVDSVAFAYPASLLNPSLNGSLGATVNSQLWGTSSDSAFVNFTTGVNSINTMLYPNGTAPNISYYRGGAVAPQNILWGMAHRYAAGWGGAAGTTAYSYFDGNVATGVAGAAPTSTNSILQLGDYNGSHAANGPIKQVCYDWNSTRCKGTTPTPSSPYFEFAPASGAGLNGGACACLPVTGSKGELLTFTRGSTAYCTKGNTLSGIQNGDLVLCPVQQPRIMPGGDGSGALGLLVEGARTNSLARSQALATGPWATASSGEGVPIVTNNAAVAPDGTSTATQIVYPAISTAAHYSVVYQTLTTTAVPWTQSLYVKGTGSPSTGIIFIDAAGAGPVWTSGTACPYNSVTWTRCTAFGTQAAANTTMQVGIDLRDGISTPQPAQTVLVWGAQWEAGSYATSYVPTTNVAVARSADTAYFVLQTPNAGKASLSAQYAGPVNNSGVPGVYALTQTVGSPTYGLGIYQNTGVGSYAGLIGNPGAAVLATSMANTNLTSAWASWNGTTFTTNFNGIQATSAPGGTMTIPASLSIGYDSAGGGANWANGVIKNVCLDPSPTKCRPPDPGPFFEFAPLSGAGVVPAGMDVTAATCACLPVTGSKGEPLVFARATSATCTKGNLTTSIQNGDLVTCPVNRPRIMPGGTGVGVLGLLNEAPVTNVDLQSAAIDNAAWLKEGSGAAAPTVTADQATAPDNNLTAERLQIPATTAGQFSGFREAVAPGIGAGAATCTAFVKGNGTSGTVDMCAQGGVYTCTPCSFVSSSWTRCKVSVTAVAGGLCYVGNMTAINGGTARAAADIFVWGRQFEQSAYATSYIPTTTVAVARALEGGYVDLVGGVRANVSVAVTTAGLQATHTTSGALFAINAASTTPSDTSGTSALWAYNAATTDIRCYYGGSATPNVLWTAGVNRFWCRGIAATSITGQLNATPLTAGAAPVAASDLRYADIGGIYNQPYSFDVVSKQFCLDPSPTRCQ